MNAVKLLPIGTRVHHPGHGDGVIVSYNGTPKNSYLDDQFQDVIRMANQAGLLQGLISSGFYSCDKYPYVVQFDAGYKGYYSTIDVEEIKEVNHG